MNKCISDGCEAKTRKSDRCAKHKIYHRECKNCGKAFTTKNRKTLCCSGECGTAVWKKELPEARCETCGKTYRKASSEQLYCAPKCRPRPEVVERKPSEAQCVECGGSFMTATQRKTCSDECATKRQENQGRLMWSELRRGYEDNDPELFFTALITDCDTASPLGCWTWNRMRNKFGYPIIKFRNTNVYLHRVSLEMAEGKPLGVLHAHHKCANTACVNPNHLEPATAAENSLEMLARNSYLARIAELEGVISELAPGHEVLTRVPTN